MTQTRGLWRKALILLHVKPGILVFSLSDVSVLSDMLNLPLKFHFFLFKIYFNR